MKIQKIANEAREGLRSSKGRNILTFAIFLTISTVFWILLALNDDIQKDYAVPVHIQDIPQDFTIISGYNPILNISIKDKGSALMKYSWGNTPSLKLHLDDFSQINDSTLLLSTSKLNSALRGVFGTSASIVSLRPDSLKLSFTTNPGIKVPVNIRANIRTEPQYTIAGRPIISSDSVTIFSNSPNRFKIHALSTPAINLTNLTDSVSITTKLETPRGVRAVPSSVTITFPVEPLVAKHIKVPIEVVNNPYGIRVVTFPSVVEVSYLAPKSLYNNTPNNIKASVDYNVISPTTATLQVTTSGISEPFRSITVSPSEVEYVVERGE